MSPPESNDNNVIEYVITDKVTFRFGIPVDDLFGVTRPFPLYGRFSSKNGAFWLSAGIKNPEPGYPSLPYPMIQARQWLAYLSVSSSASDAPLSTMFFRRPNVANFLMTSVAIISLLAYGISRDNPEH